MRLGIPRRPARPVAWAAAGAPASAATRKSVGEGAHLLTNFTPDGEPRKVAPLRSAPFPSLRSVREPPYRGAEVPQVTDALEGRD